MEKETCMKCGRELTKDEIAMHKKTVNRGATSYWCLDCLAEHFEVSRGFLEEKMRKLKEMGCTLFS